MKERMCMPKKSVKKRLSDEDKKDWDELYNYVKNNVMGYDQNQSLSKMMVLRLKGLLYNKFVENNRIEDTAKYSYKVILNTFKACSMDIQRGLSTKSFTDEMHKFNYVLKIVESNINNIYVRMQQAKKVDEKIEIIDMSIINNKGAEYQRKTMDTSDKYEEFW